MSEEKINSKKNLENAFAGESQANRRYLAFAEKAEREGFLQVSQLFKAAAAAETIHALNHLRILGKIKSTQENLKAAISGETFEYKKMYPNYLRTAKQEKNNQAAWSFDVANQVEKIHAKLFSKNLKALKSNEPIPKLDYFVCSVCGNTIENASPEICPVCGASKTKFFKVT